MRRLCNRVSESCKNVPGTRSRNLQPLRGDYKGYTEEPFSARPKSRPWHYDHAGLVHEPVRKGRTRDSFGQFGPQIHRGPGFLANETRASERANSGVPPLAECRNV